MQTTWITRDDNTKLRIVTLGWAADPTMVTPVDGFDTVCTYDYRTIDNIVETLELQKYSEIHLVAWSYGVWAAEQIFAGQGQIFTSATAINGTPLPTHDKYGIPQRIFDLTVANIEKAGTEKFVQRMCFGMPEPVRLQRGNADCVEELKTLAQLFKNGYTPSIKWTNAVIGMKDLIFPPTAQQSYWLEVAKIAPDKIRTIEDMPHCPVGII